MLPITVEINGPESRIVGHLPDDVVRFLRYQLSFAVNGAYFAEAYQEGRWDGRKYLMTERGRKFPTGLVSRVVELLRLSNYEVTLVDPHPMPDAEHFMPIRLEEKLYDYQRNAVDQAIYFRNGMLRIATGGGKTRVGCAIISELERPAIFLVHRIDLLNQVLGVLRGVDGKPGLMKYPEVVGQVGGGVYEPNLITVMTVQTACAALGITQQKERSDDEHEASPRERMPHKAEAIVRDVVEAAQVLVLDEAQHAPAATIFDVLQRMRNARWRIGLSATDWRDDGADLYIEGATGPRLVDISLSDLISWGRLVPAHITMHEIACPTSGWDNTNWNSAYSAGIVKNDELNQKVLEINEQWLNEGRTVLTLVRAVKHGVSLKRMHKERGLDTVFLSGSDAGDYRIKILDRIRAGNLRHLIATSIADEGLDLPILDALNLAGGGKSSTLAYQRIGRVLRTAPGKTEGLVADYDVRDGNWLHKHANTRKGIYRREKGFILQ